MRSLIAFGLGVLLPVSVLADPPGDKVSHDSSSANEKFATQTYTYIAPNQLLLTQKSAFPATTPVASATGMSNGQGVHSRVDAAIAAAGITVGLGVLKAFIRSNLRRSAKRDHTVSLQRRP